MGITQPTRIELLRLVPLLLIVVHRPEVDDDPGTLGDGIFPNAAKWTQSEAVTPSPQSLPMTWMWPKVSPGVGEGHVWDEQGGHGPDAQHLTDGGLQVGQQRAVTEVGVTYQANLVVHFLLDLPLDLGAKQRPVWKPREEGALCTVKYTQHHQQHGLSVCVGQKCPQPDLCLSAEPGFSFGTCLPKLPMASLVLQGTQAPAVGCRPYLWVVEQVEHSPFEHSCGGLHTSPKDVPHCHEEVVVSQLQPWLWRAAVLSTEPHLQEGIHEVLHGVSTESFLPRDMHEPGCPGHKAHHPSSSISLSWPCWHLVFSEFLLEQLVPDLEAFLQQGQVLVGKYLREKSTCPPVYWVLWVTRTGTLLTQWGSYRTHPSSFLSSEVREMGSAHIPAHLEPGEDVHQALLGHGVHNTLAVLQHGLELRVPTPV